MDSLIGEYRKMAGDGTDNFHGLSLLQHADSVGRMVRITDSKTLLDFGCGRGDPYKSPHKVWHKWGLDRHAVTLYDPAFNASSELPKGKFDIVVCSDVLEHVPEDEVDAFIERLFNYAVKGVWASVCCRPAKKKFPNGDNLHVCVKPHSWWLEKFKSAAEGRPRIVFTLIETP